MAEEYIKKEDAIQSVMNHDLLKSDWSRAWAEYMLEDAPTADVVPVRHGEWIHPREYGLNLPEHYCSECREWEYSDTESKYCPNCGAKMDKEVDE